jgi:hypothetical protein
MFVAMHAPMVNDQQSHVQSISFTYFVLPHIMNTQLGTMGLVAPFQNWAPKMHYLTHQSHRLTLLYILRIL